MGPYRTSAKVLDRVVEAPRMEAPVASSVPERNQMLYRLFVLNILLQIFDGVATYSGLQLGVREGNPLLCSAFHWWGVVPTLLVLKATVCVLLLFVYRVAREQLALPALTVLASVGAACSFIPWLAAFLMLLVHLS